VEKRIAEGMGREGGKGRSKSLVASTLDIDIFDDRLRGKTGRDETRLTQVGREREREPNSKGGGAGQPG